MELSVGTCTKKRSRGIIRKSRVSYPGLGFLSSATWPSLPIKHYNGLNKSSFNITKRVTFAFIVQSLFYGPDLNPPNIWIKIIQIAIQIKCLHGKKIFNLDRNLHRESDNLAACKQGYLRLLARLSSLNVGNAWISSVHILTLKN